MKQWIKFYTEALHDRKMRKLPRVEKSVFYDLLLLAGQEDKDGILPEIDDIALELDLKPSETQKFVSNLITVGLLSKTEKDNLMITNYHKRQEANSTGYERVKRYRDNHKNVINDNAMITDDNVINDNGHDNADDTQMITVEKEIEIDKEIDINTLSKDSVYTPAKKSAKPKSEKQKFGSMQNVLLTPEEYAKLCERFPDADAKIESLSLAIASKGYKYKDHYATVLNWARMDADKPKTAPKQETKKTYSFAEVGEMLERGEIVL